VSLLMYRPEFAARSPRRPRFRLRTLMIAVTIAGCALGYWRVYLVTSTTFTDGFPRTGAGLLRVYGTTFEARIFKPAAVLESIASGRHVDTAVWT